MIGAVIYVRVSTKEQTENLSLPTQIRACEEYCRREGYEVLELFKEEGESAKTTDRTELQNLLKYCRTHKGRVHFVVVYNLTRFAREKYDHFALRAFLKSLGISLRSATEPIDDTSTGKLMEGVLAAFAQFDNDVRSERTRAGMRAALEQGRWTFVPPLGYLNAPKWSGKSLTPDPDRAPLVTRAFDEFATGRFTKEEVLGTVTRLGLRTRSGLVLNPQSFGRMLTNRLYAGFIDVPEFGVSRRGDFEALVSEETFRRVQAILHGRVHVSGPRQRSRPDFPLKGLVRCAKCGRELTASWSKGRNGRYAYYHCWRQCRAVNITKAKLEGLFVDELKQLQPTPGYMRLVKELVLRAWQERKTAVGREATDTERRAKAIQQKLDRLDEAFLFAQSIDITTYERQRDRLRQELTLTDIDRHSAQVEKIDVEGILAFAERVLPRASDLWVQASLNQRQRLQQLFFPDGIAFDGRQFVRTAVTANAFKYLTAVDSPQNNLMAAPATYGERLAAAVTCLTRQLQRASDAIDQSAAESGVELPLIRCGFDPPSPLTETRGEFLQRGRAAWAFSQRILKPPKPPNLEIQAEWAVRYCIAPTEKVGAIARDAHRSSEAVRCAIATVAKVLGLPRRPRGRPRKPRKVIRWRTSR